MSWVLAVEPNRDQRLLLRQALVACAQDQTTIVDSINEALVPVALRVPEVILLSALISPVEEARLIAYLRAQRNAAFLQTLTTPWLAPAAATPPRRWRPFWRRRYQLEPLGCKVDAFRNQLHSYLDRAVQDRLELAERLQLESDRRDGRRLSPGDRVRLFVSGSTVELVDLSLTGAQIVSASRLAPGDVVSIVAEHYQNARRFEGEIMWGGLDMPRPVGSTRYRVGVRFKDGDYSFLTRVCAPALASIAGIDPGLRTTLPATRCA